LKYRAAQKYIIKTDPSALENSSDSLWEETRGEVQHKRKRDGFPAIVPAQHQGFGSTIGDSFSSAHRQISKRTNDLNGPAFISKEEKNSYLFSGSQFSPHAAEDTNKRAGNERD